MAAGEAPVGVGLIGCLPRIYHARWIGPSCGISIQFDSDPSSGPQFGGDSAVTGRDFLSDVGCALNGAPADR